MTAWQRSRVPLAQVTVVALKAEHSANMGTTRTRAHAATSARTYRLILDLSLACAVYVEESPQQYSSRVSTRKCHPDQDRQTTAMQTRLGVIVRITAAAQRQHNARSVRAWAKAANPSRLETF